MMQQNRCPKCEGAMGAGFVLDATYGANTVGTWIEGAPVKSIWTGLKLRGRRRLPIETWRCTRCGFLESYASATS